MVHITRGDVNSKHTLRDEPTKLKATVTKYNADGTIGEIQETTTEEVHKMRMRLRGARKQRAARIVRPINSIVVVVEKTVRPVEAVLAEVAGAPKEDVRILELMAQIEKIKKEMGLIVK